MDHALRRARAAAALPGLELDALLVTHLPNVRYLTGFSGSSAELLLGREAAVLLIDGRYAAQAARESPALERRTCLDGYVPAAAETAAALGDRIGFEREALSFARWERLREAAVGLELVPTSGLVEALREVKDEDERALIAAGQGAADAAFDEVVLGGGLRAGVREQDVGLALEVAMRRAGADAPGFEPIVGFGENAAEPHHRPGARELRRGDLVTTDFGAAVGGYRSDMTRTVAFGEPGRRLRDVYALVASAQAAGVEAVRDGVVAGDVDSAARRVIADAGLADAFPHPVGHAVGLEIHESPILRSTCRTVLRAGAVVTVEPGVYLPGVAGVRIEDMVEVTPEGPHVIPRTSKELIVL
ncbi:MAG TPA: Xaa-Pro peptidase family protein [Actinomycetota bacterium]